MCSSTKYQPVHLQGQAMGAFKKLVLEFVRFLIIQIHSLFDCTVDFVFGLYYDSKVQRVPPIKDKLLLESSISLASKIRNKEVSAEKVVTAFVERCKEVNGLLNAIVDERYENAIKEAREVDKWLQTQNLSAQELKKIKPLLGVPYTTKEANVAKGTLHSMGMVCRKGHRSEDDAVVIANVRKAGAILVGKTNIPEMCLWVESRNLIYGQTNNPYDTTRTVGGSSGGDGAIVAAGGVPFAVGSDIGGSIRIPAVFNGVFGHKPSNGYTSLKGIGLRTKDGGEKDSMAECGPICKKAEDLDILMTIFAGSILKESINASTVNIKALKVFYQESSEDIRASKVCNATRTALAKAVRHFENQTGGVTKIKIPGTEYSYRLWRYWMTQEDSDFKFDITNRKERACAKAEVMKLITGRSELTLAALLKLIDIDLFPQENEDWAKNTTNKMKAYLLEKLGNDGVLLYPSMNPAPYHFELYLRPYNFGYTALFNVLKLPTCHIPMGLNDKGIPVGIQVVAGPNNDQMCLAVAKELEEAFGGWVPPS